MGETPMLRLKLLEHRTSDGVFQGGVAAGGVPVGSGEVQAAVGFAGALGGDALGAVDRSEVGAGGDRLLRLSVALDDDAGDDGVAAGDLGEVKTQEAAVGVEGVLRRL